MKRILRFFGFCGHEWEWSPEVLEFGDSDYQRASCVHCGKIKQRKVGWPARRDKYGDDAKMRAYKKQLGVDP